MSSSGGICSIGYYTQNRSWFKYMNTMKSIRHHHQHMVHWMMNYLKGEHKCSNPLDANLYLDTPQNSHDVNFSDFLFIKSVILWLKVEILFFFKLSHDATTGSRPTDSYSLLDTSWYDLIQTANNFRFATISINTSLVVEIINSEMVSCYTNSWKIQGLTEIGQNLPEIPECGLGLENVRFCTRNILQRTVMKQHRWLDLVIIHHAWEMMLYLWLSTRNSRHSF